MVWFLLQYSRTGNSPLSSGLRLLRLGEGVEEFKLWSNRSRFRSVLRPSIEILVKLL